MEVEEASLFSQKVLFQATTFLFAATHSLTVKGLLLSYSEKLHAGSVHNLCRLWTAHAATNVIAHRSAQLTMAKRIEAYV